MSLFSSKNSLCHTMESCCCCSLARSAFFGHCHCFQIEIFLATLPIQFSSRNSPCHKVIAVLCWEPSLPQCEGLSSLFLDRYSYCLIFITVSGKITPCHTIDSFCHCSLVGAASLLFSWWNSPRQNVITFFWNSLHHTADSCYHCSSE